MEAGNFVTGGDYLTARKPAASEFFKKENTLLAALFTGSNRGTTAKEIKAAAEQVYRNMFGLAEDTELTEEQDSEVKQIGSFIRLTLASYFRLGEIYFDAFTEQEFLKAKEAQSPDAAENKLPVYPSKLLTHPLSVL